MENPNLKWMMTRGTPLLGNLHIKTWVFLSCNPFPLKQETQPGNHGGCRE